MKSALITGVTGQDGAYLSEFLINRGYKVFGTFRRLSTPNFWRLQYLNIEDKITLIPMDLGDEGSILEAINVSQPDEIYNLAAQSFVGASFDQPLATGEMTALATTRMLEALRVSRLDARFYQASTSELFGNSSQTNKNENTPFSPRSPYAAAKLYAFWMSKIYREGYKLYVTNGILFNHESPLRGLEFVTRKISNAVARISLGLQKKLYLGNVNAYRDWGYAKDYVESMWKMLNSDQPGDYVIATGESHSVLDFVKVAFEHVDLSHEDYLETKQDLYRPLEVDHLRGDSSKAQLELGWKPKMNFVDLVKLMVDEDVKRWKMRVEGEIFPWDAPLYPENINIASTRVTFDR